MNINKIIQGVSKFNNNENNQKPLNKANVKIRLSDYLDFHVDSLFDLSGDFAIFGGAVRDSIANRKIHDIDILCLPHGFKQLVDFFTESNFKKVRANYDIENMYKGVRLIREPITFQKDNCIVQLIRPCLGKIEKNITVQQVTDSIALSVFYKTLSHVDLSCCGVYYQNGTVYESVHNAIRDCSDEKFRVNFDALMINSERLQSRIYKLEGRGWTKYEDTPKINQHSLPDDELNYLVNKLKLKKYIR